MSLRGKQKKEQGGEASLKLTIGVLPASLEDFPAQAVMVGIFPIGQWFLFSWLCYFMFNSAGSRSQANAG